MTLLILVLLIVTFISMIVGAFPIVTELPFGTDAVLQQAVGMFHTLAVWVPPLEIMFNGFLAILTFKAIMLFLHLIRVIR